MEKTDYSKYRGKCKEFCIEAQQTDPTLTLVRGHYICPFWGEQQHWWLTRLDGTIYDPTVKQFPSSLGEYIPFSGNVTCSECGKSISEDHADFVSNYAFCSGVCYGKFVGVI